MPFTDNFIVDSLAQFYTEQFCYRNQDYYLSKIANAYDKFLTCQSGPYVAHIGWRKTYSLEGIRGGFVELRRKEIRHFEEFKQLLDSNNNRLKKKSQKN